MYCPPSAQGFGDVQRVRAARVRVYRTRSGSFGIIPAVAVPVGTAVVKGVESLFAGHSGYTDPTAGDLARDAAFFDLLVAQGNLAALQQIATTGQGPLDPTAFGPGRTGTYNPQSKARAAAVLQAAQLANVPARPASTTVIPTMPGAPGTVPAVSVAGCDPKLLIYVAVGVAAFSLLKRK